MSHPAQQDTVLATEQLSKSFGDRTALDGITFYVPRGRERERVGRVGVGRLQEVERRRARCIAHGRERPQRREVGERGRRGARGDGGEAGVGGDEPKRGTFLRGREEFLVRAEVVARARRDERRAARGGEAARGEHHVLLRAAELVRARGERAVCHEELAGERASRLALEERQLRHGAAEDPQRQCVRATRRQATSLVERRHVGLAHGAREVGKRRERLRRRPCD